MEELKDKLERTKCYVRELLNEMGCPDCFNETYIEDVFFDPFLAIGNTYKLAYAIVDKLISHHNNLAHARTAV